jgi:phosphopantothenoylcysteine decarboxylase/phosphopantothenate--cysteine ligase
MSDKKTVLLGVTGGIAAYKMANVASSLVKMGFNVHVIMTENATNFITPTTFETLTSNKCITDTFDRNFQFEVEHISLAKKADVVLIAPATANVIGKMANGIADDMLTTTLLACKCPKIVAPAMNTNMYENPIVRDNIAKLMMYGFKIIPADSGRLACGDTGKGKLPDESVLIEYIMRELCPKKDLMGKNILVTAGPTREALDPVRYITNHSTGKMGYAIARAAAFRGANVTLVSGPVNIDKPLFVNTVNVTSAKDMFNAVKDNYENQHIIIKAAAVADYTPSTVADNKIKKSDSDMSISLDRTDDILKFLGENKKDNQFICGFSMETENLIENSRGKLERKNADMIVANSLRTEGAGFGTDTNVVTLITKDSVKECELMSKNEVADMILDAIIYGI